MSFFKKKNIIFISLILILNILLMLIFKYKHSQTYIQELSNQLYSKNSIEFIDSNVNKSIDILQNENNYRLFVELDDTFRFFKSNDENWSPPIFEGNFFSTEISGKNAVIGKSLIKNIQKVNGIDVIKFNNEYYKVIGIMGENFPTRIDSLILLSSDKIPKINNSKIIIDSNNKSLIKRVTKIISSENGFKLLEKEDLGLNKLVKTDFFSNFFLIVSILVVMFSILVYIRYWFEKEVPFLKLLNLLGFRRKKIIAIYLGNIFFNTFISSVFTVIIVLIFKKIFALNILIISLLVTNISIIFISIIYIIDWNRFTKKLMRRKRK